MKKLVLSSVLILAISSMASAGTWENGIWTHLEAPSSNQTIVRNIDGDNLVGSVDGRGFLYNRISNSWTFYDAPGAVGTSVDGIDGNTIIGSYRDANNVSHGFTYTAL